MIVFQLIPAVYFSLTGFGDGMFTPLTAISFLTGWSAAYPPAANKFSKSSKDKKRIDFMFLLFLEF